MVSLKTEMTGSHLITYTVLHDYDILRQRAALLNSERISIFGFDEEECAAAQRRVTGGMGHVDLINGKPQSRGAEPVPIRTGKEGDMVVVGWAADAENEEPADKVLLVINGKPAARAFYGIRRPDVSRAFENDALLLTGWEAFIDVRKLDEGVHELSIQVLSEDGNLCYKPDKTYFMKMGKSREKRPRGKESDGADKT
jgi:hypothetical protein